MPEERNPQEQIREGLIGFLRMAEIPEELIEEIAKEMHVASMRYLRGELNMQEFENVMKEIKKKYDDKI